MTISSAERGIVLAPSGRDGAIAVAILGEADLEAVNLPDLATLVKALRAGAGFALVTEECLRSADLRELGAFLSDQEEWSDFPFILLTQRGGGLERNPAAGRFLETLGNVTFLERPFHPTTLISLAKAALRARRRQYDARARLETINARGAQFRAFAQTMANHVWTSPASGELDWFNERVFEYSGKSLVELAGNNWADIVHPDDRDAAARAWSASVVTGDAYETEFRIQRHDGTYRWHLVRAQPILGSDGRVTRWVGTNTDIHEQKLSEVASVRDRDRLWMLSQDVMLVCDFAGKVTAVSPSATRLLGWREDEMVGKNVAVFIHPDDIENTTAEIAKLSQGGPALAFENRCSCKDGGVKLLAWTAVPDEGRIHAVGRDITGERTLARDRERIWNLSPVVKVVATVEGKILAVNPSWTKVLGYTAGETIGRNILEFVDPEVRALSEAALATMAAGVKVEVERAYLTKKGERRQIAWITVPESATLYSFGRDVTAEVEAAEALVHTEAALRQSQKMEAVGQLTGGIAHDFNNLLQGITGSLEIIERRLAEGRSDGVNRFLAGATTAANRAAALTHRLLAFSRRQPLDPRPVLANQLVRSNEDLLRRTLGEHIDLTLSLEDNLWATLCDGNQLENAVLNLVINARDAMPEGGKLTIETSNADLEKRDVERRPEMQAGQYVRIRVSDTGIGMNEETMSKAFEPFFTTKPLGKGTGLGLSMIYGFARQSEGFATIDSTPGKGSVFTLYLPRHQGQVVDDEQNPPTASRSTDAAEVILVVEDEPVVRDLIIEVLSELGYRVHYAGDGPEGLEKLRQLERIDLLVTDIGLPGLNGRQIADAGRNLRPGLKVLFMTGYAENAALPPSFLDPDTAIITKPFTMDSLGARVQEILGRVALSLQD